MIDCHLTLCELKDIDCVTPLAPPSNFVIGPSPLFLITASEIIPEGYAETFCYSCTITPTGLPPIAPPFTKLINVVAEPLDCSGSLVPNPAFVDPPAISYTNGLNYIIA